MSTRRLFIPAGLCLVTVGATKIGPEEPWPRIADRSAAARRDRALASEEI